MKQYRPSEIIKTGKLYIVIICMFCAVTAYYILNPVWMIIGQEKGISMDTLVVGMMIAMFANAIGRLVASNLSDKLGRKPLILALYVILFIGCLGMWLFGGVGLIAAFVIVAFCYGGFLSTFPAISTDLFGVKYAGVNYGLVMIGMGLASLFTMFMSSAFTNAGLSVTSRCIPAAIITVAGILFGAILKIKKPKKN